MAAATTPLTEAVDVDAVALADTTVSITLQEYGNATIPTAKVRALSYKDIDEDVANLVGYNAGLSLDTIARAVMQAGTNVRYATGGTTDPTSNATVEAEDVITGFDVAYVVAKLRGANVQAINGSYAGIIHPDVSVDLRKETDASGWLVPANYDDSQKRWNGEIGTFNGVRFMESPRAPSWADTGSPSTVDAYGTLIFGQEALAKAFSSGAGYTGGPLPTVTIADKADNLNRFRAVGWKWLGGYKIFREAALWRIMSGASIASN